MPGSTTLLCFDFGTKRIGVAVGQTLTDTASPLEIITVRNNRPDWERIGALINQWQPQALVVGNPLNMDGSRHPIGAAVDAFARKLQGRYRLPVLQADERLSTVEARARQRNSDAVESCSGTDNPRRLVAGWRRGQKML